MNEKFTFSAMPAIPILLALLLVAAALVVFVYWRTTRPLKRRLLIFLGILRWTFLAGILFCLFEPALISEIPRERKGFFVVAVDTSASMAIPDGGSGKTRLQRAREILEQSDALKDLPENINVRHFSFDSHARRLANMDNLKASGERTALFDCTAEILDRYRGMPLAGMLIISDGADNSGQNVTPALSKIRGAGVPIYAASVGALDSAVDLALTQFEMPRAVKSGTRVPARVSFAGDPGPQRRIVVDVLQGNNVVATETVTWQPGVSAQTVELKFIAEGKGYQRFTAHVQGDAQEMITDNNHRVRYVKLEDEGPPRVLYVDSRPRQEYKFVKRSLEKDDWISFSSLLYVGVKAVRTGLSENELRLGLPASGDELSRFKVVILGDFPPASWNVDQIAALDDFVGKRGGGLLLLGGPTAFSASMVNSTLGDLCPFVFQQYSNTYAITNPAKTTLTATGLSHPMMQGLLDPKTGSVLYEQAAWANLPTITGGNLLYKTKPAATVIAQWRVGNQDFPLVAVQRYGAGKVLAIASDQLWRWQMLLPAEDDHYERFMRQAVRWLGEIELGDVTLTVDRDQVAPGEPVQIAVQAFDSRRRPLADANVNLQVSSPDGSLETISVQPDLKVPGSFNAVWSPRERGEFGINASVSSNGHDMGFAQAMVIATTTQLELTRAGRNDGFLQLLTESTRGKLSRPGELIQLSAAIETLPEPEKITVQRSAWDRGWLLAVLAALLCGEWVLRRALGLS